MTRGTHVLAHVIGQDAQRNVDRLQVAAVVLEDAAATVTLELAGIVPAPYRAGDVVTLPRRDVLELDTDGARRLEEWLTTVA